ncbi:S53 family peptidase [Tunturibacter empetritectus]|uniref:Kumamolisin n=1 Tax=Tunturiibacter lichenicola TaxID=2051959 RepID=A0A7W8J897_9BACT|nr:S53 family peptidase [Edaphobacter lichenicola]MBB5344460.1 kumamolisin [Edaphobacter lichenicola]
MFKKSKRLNLDAIKAILIGACISPVALAGQSDAGFKQFDNSIVRLPSSQSGIAALSNDAKSRKLEIHFTLKTTNLEELEARVARGEIISSQEMTEKYSGSKAQYNQLLNWLKPRGFQITQVSADFTNIYAKASVADIEKTLGVKMVVVTYQGRTEPSAITPPKLPIEVGDSVIAIGGLQPVIQAVKHIVTRKQSGAMGGDDKAPVPRPAFATQPTFKVNEILNAYGAGNLGVSGRGERIAILIDTFPKVTDLQTFWQKGGLPITLDRVKVINVQGSTAPLSAPDGEETLDVEWASGIAPGAEIRVYASGSLDYDALDRALDTIYSDAQKMDGLNQVSISLGLREDLVSPDEIKAEHIKFLRFQGRGITVFVSSGDAGSNPDASGHARSPDPPQVEYQSSDPSTAAVGGTTLSLDRSTGRVLSETGWIDSGGGVSASFPRPVWQTSAGATFPGKRLVPDVSAVADPNPGAFVWFKGKEWPVGGTSWSAPMWAGFSALIGEWRRAHGKPPLGFLPFTLYKLQTGLGVRDITKGSNGFYSAGVGWDPVTGLGVPDLGELVKSIP